MINVLYFARLRDDLGRATDQLEASAAIATAADVWRALNASEPPARVLVAINQMHAGLDAPVADGDEVAFFPPVTGG